MRKCFLTFSFAFLLAACGNSSEVVLTEIEYKQALGQAVCEAVTALNQQGILDNEAEFAAKFDGEVQKSVRAMGYKDRDWLAAKDKYFPDEGEHNKLIKLHFTWCLVGDSISAE